MMAQLCGADVISPQFLGEFDELDHVPLVSRRNLMFESKTGLVAQDDIVLKQEDDESENASSDQNIVMPNNGHRAHNTACTLSEQIDIGEVNISGCTMNQNPSGSSISIEREIESPGNMILTALGDHVNDVNGADMLADKVNDNITSDFLCDDVDHVLLKERRRMLLERGLQQLVQPIVEGSSVCLSKDVQDAVKIKEDPQSVDVESVLAGKEHNRIPKTNTSSLTAALVNDSSANDNALKKQYLEVSGCSVGIEAPKSGNNNEKNDKICSSEKTFVELNMSDGQHNVLGNTGIPVSGPQTLVKVKAEPSESNDFNHSENDLSGKLSFNTQRVKIELGIPNELGGDGVEHMRLRDRLNPRGSSDNSEFKSSSSFAYKNKVAPADFDSGSVFSDPPNPRMLFQRKRKKTATDSVEIALEEDAPGLLKVLIEQGVSIDEMKLYGESETDDALDESLCKDSFAELEAVVSKLFSQRTSLLRFAPVHCTKGTKRSYCVACLFSLVEQARYLQFRNWPVEWGWCRDLQSFIFVFKRHNRIVLERPEYGYATYFFELVDSSPIQWQVKRLVTAMKLTCCGRVNVIENKLLRVGDDLSEGEAKVLMEFGWVPNTGLATMLHYCDRVYHDRKNEKDSSEWRSKIGKLLMDGYNGGTIVSTNMVLQHGSSDSLQVKLEKVKALRAAVRS